MQSTKRVRVVADEIRDYLVAADRKPQMVAMARQQAEQARLQEMIQSNIADIRARGTEENAARARANARNEEYLRREWNTNKICFIRIVGRYAPW